MRPNLILSLIALMLCALAVHAQSPPGINYQGVARDLDGKPLVLKDITIKTSILKNGSNGEVEYSEVHNLKTNSFGLFTLVIGTGHVAVGDFQFISWAVGGKWLRIEMDPEGGNSFQVMGAQEFMSVPYAFYSKYSGSSTSLTPGQGISIANNVISNTGDGDSNASNELNSSFTLSPDRKLRLTDAGGTKEVDLSTLSALQATPDLITVLSAGSNGGGRQISNIGAPTLGTDVATKDYVDSKVVTDTDTDEQDLMLSGNTLSIENSATTIDLTPFLDNTDNQNLSSSAVGTNRTINISGGTGVTINVADNDNNSMNELQDLTLSGTTLSLSSDATTVDMSGFMDNTDNQLLTFAGNNLSLSGGNSVNLAPLAADNQTLTLSPSDNLSISGGNSVNLSGYKDNTDHQDLSLSGNTLSLTNDGTAVDLAPYMQGLSSSAAGTNRTVSITGGTPATFSVADNDNDPVNEIQTLTYVPATKNLTIASGNTVNIPETQNINQVLTQGNDAGGQKITNVGAPTALTDVVTKQYVDNGTAAINARLSNNYAFKATFSFDALLAASNVTMPFVSEDFDDFSVMGAANFTAPEAGIYMFVVDANFSGLSGTLSLFYNGVKHTVTTGGGRYNSTFFFKMTVGQTISLIGDNLLLGVGIDGTLSGYKVP